MGYIKHFPYEITIKDKTYTLLSQISGCMFTGFEGRLDEGYAETEEELYYTLPIIVIRLPMENAFVYRDEVRFDWNS